MSNLDWLLPSCWMPAVNVALGEDDLYRRWFRHNLDLERRLKDFGLKSDQGCQEQTGQSHELLQTFLKSNQFYSEIFFSLTLSSSFTWAILIHIGGIGKLLKRKGNLKDDLKHILWLSNFRFFIRNIFSFKIVVSTSFQHLLTCKLFLPKQLSLICKAVS